MSECEEGIGSEEFRLAQQKMVGLGPGKFLEGLMLKSHADIDEWQTEMLLRSYRGAGQAGNIHLWSPNMAGEGQCH